MGDPDSWYRDVGTERQPPRPPPKYNDLSMTTDDRKDMEKERSQYEPWRQSGPPPKPPPAPGPPAPGLAPVSPPRHMPPWSLLMYDYSQNTSMHGLRYVTESSRFVIRRVMWGVIFLTALSVFLYYMVSRVSYYLEFNKNVNVEVNYLSKVAFPPVTFCNQNAFRITPVADHGWYNMVKSLFGNKAAKVNRQCNVDEFQCVGDSSCVSLTKRCDVFPDCADNSDELNCVICPLVWLTAPDPYLTSLPHVFARSYEVQPNTWNSSRPVYVTNTEPLSYLYWTAGHWNVGMNYNTGALWARVLSSADDAVGIVAGNWTVDYNGTWNAVNGVTVTCKYDYLDLLAEGNSSVIPGLNLTYLYETAAHQRAEFIQSCVWKGNICADIAIKSVVTDMGVCYTFEPSDAYIEQSGPGYGLSLTVNIEQYEYTKSTDEGIGLKLLMHKSGDVTMMQERGTAVSPGLYSFISVETTQVTNLEPPWGTCGTSKLTYYPDYYSISRCKMECYTKYVNDHCKCRDLNMPDINGVPPVCEVSTYIDCAKPALDEVRAAGNYCTSCPTPCTVDTYVPTTSFSIVLSSAESDAQDQESYRLKTKLFKARETTYRVVKDKYLLSMRNFHILIQQLGRKVKFTRAVESDLSVEYGKVTTHAHQTQADCIWMRDLIFTARDNIDKYIIENARNYLAKLLPRAYMGIKELRDVVAEAMSHIAWIHASNNGSSLWQEYLYQYTSEKNNTVWTMYNQVKASLRQLMDDRPGLHNAINAIPLSSDFIIRDQLLGPLLPNIGTHCPWCVEVPSKAVIRILEARVLNQVDNSLYNNLNSARTSLMSAYENYMKNLWIANHTIDVTWWEVNNYNNKMNSAEGQINSAVSKLDNVIADSSEAARFIDDIIEYAWNLKCQTELPKLLNEYEGNHKVLWDLITGLDQYLSVQRDAVVSYSDQYIAANLSLEYVGGQIKFTEMLAMTAGNKVRLDSILEARIIYVEDIAEKIRQIFYVLMALVDDPYIASQSAYWQEFSLTAPGTQLPSVKMINSVTVPLSDFGMIPDPALLAHWNAMTNRLRTIKDNLQLQVDAIDEVLTKASTYFSTYILGNQLNADFYSKNFLQVELFYKELTERKISQQVAYDYQNLLSELGGFMGLLLGASVISLFELFDVFVYNGFRSCMRPKVRPKPKPKAWE